MTSPARSGALLIAGSPSDLDLVLQSQEVLESFGIPSEIRVLSAHRTPEAVVELVSGAERAGTDVIIAFAGLAAHLAGVVAAHTMLPVIGVPVASGPLRGIDAALSTLQMPPGTPVATVAIDGAKNAALLAARILAVREPELRDKLRAQLEIDRERYDAEQIAAEIESRKKARASKARR